MRLVRQGLLLVVPLLFCGRDAISGTIVAGGGPAKPDCYVGFMVDADRTTQAKGVTIKESACGGSCNFSVRACSGLTVNKCTVPSALTDVMSGLLPKPPLSGGGCGDPVAVSLTPKGKHAAKKKFALLGLASVKPKKDKDNLVLVCLPNSADCTPNTTTTTSTTIPSQRVFDVGGTNSQTHIFAGILGDPNTPADMPATATGTLVLVKGTPGTDGIATLTLSTDAVIGMQVLDTSYACLKIEAAGSSGKIACNGNLPVDVVATGDSHEDTDGHNDPPTVVFEQGSPGPAGSAYLKANARFVNCADDGSHDGPAGGCLQPFTNGSADCADPTKVDFSLSKLVLTGSVSTTGMAMSSVVHGKVSGAPGDVPPIAKTGQPFDCATFTEPGKGILETPALFYDFPLVSGDVTAMLQLGENAP